MITVYGVPLSCILRTFRGRVTGLLSPKGAENLYYRLDAARLHLLAKIDWAKMGWWRRWLLWPYWVNLEDVVNDLEDLMDTLAWSFDPTLVRFSEKAVLEIEKARLA